MSENSFPHGECECRNGCSCARKPGPAAFEVTREGKVMRVCTRCDFSSDKPTRKLIVQPEDPSAVFLDYDAFGWLCIVAELGARLAPKETEEEVEHGSDVAG